MSPFTPLASSKGGASPLKVVHGNPGEPRVFPMQPLDRRPLLLLHDVQDDLRVRPLDVLHRDEALDERVELLRVLEAGDDHAVVLPRDVVHVDDLHDHEGPRGPRGYLAFPGRTRDQYASCPFARSRSFRSRSSIGGCVDRALPNQFPWKGFTIQRLAAEGLPKAIGFWRFRYS